MRSFIAAFGLAALVCWLSTPFVRRWAQRVGAVAHPGGRHVHRQSIPRLGGVAICLGFLVPIAALPFFPESVVASAFVQEPLKAAGILVGSIAMCVLGVADDVRPMRALHKLYAQVGVGTFAFLCGFRIDAIMLPWGTSMSMGILALPVTLLWIIGIVNAINLIDGLDGLAGGVVFFAGVTNFTVAAVLTQESFTGVLLAAMLGAVLAFLFYNSNPARIFMGDSGSYFLGFLLAATSLSGGAPKVSTAVTIVVPVLALGVPIFDTLFAIVRRVLERRPVFAPDRGHIHHRLIDLGLTHRRAVLTLYGASLVFTVLSLAMALDRSWDVGVTLVIASIALVGVIRFFGGRRRQAVWSRDASGIRRALPELSCRLATAVTVDELYEALEAFARKAEIDSVELLEKGGVSAFSWPAAGGDPVQSAAIATIYPVGPDATARADFRLGWNGDSEDIAPEADILLQIVTDLLESSLRRMGSELAPPEEPFPHALRDALRLRANGGRVVVQGAAEPPLPPPSQRAHGSV